MPKLMLLFMPILIVMGGCFSIFLIEDNEAFAFTEKQKLGYAIGSEFGKSLKKMDPPINLELLLQGVQDGYKGHELIIPYVELEKARETFMRSRVATNPPDKLGKTTIPENVSIINSDKVNLDTPEGAAVSFIALYNDIKPNYEKKHLQEICQEVGTKSFQDVCLEICSSRLDFLKMNIRNIKGAFFSPPYANKLAEGDNFFLVTWNESLLSLEGGKTDSTHSIQLGVVKRDDEWRVNSSLR